MSKTNMLLSQENQTKLIENLITESVNNNMDKFYSLLDKFDSSDDINNGLLELAKEISKPVELKLNKALLNQDLLPKERIESIKQAIEGITRKFEVIIYNELYNKAELYYRNLKDFSYSDSTKSLVNTTINNINAA